MSEEDLMVGLKYLLVDELIEKEMKEKKIKICPTCGILTEKVNGCNFMDCIKCKIGWCWECNKVKGNSGCENKEHNSH